MLRRIVVQDAEIQMGKGRARTTAQRVYTLRVFVAIQVLSMFPGMGGRMDPRRMNQMMKQLGINVEEIDNVQEVIIRTPKQDYVFDRADVSIMTAQGTKTYQVTGTPKIVAKSGGAAASKPAPTAPPAAPVALPISDDDVKLVAEQTGKKPSDARKALVAANGDIAEAIVKLSEE
jgi:nascent polypeptide-associated complex subunit alpha